MSDGQTLHLLRELVVEPRAKVHPPENGDHLSFSYLFLTQLLLAAVSKDGIFFWRNMWCVVGLVGGIP